MKNAVRSETPNAVRNGRLRGRSSTWCSLWSPVANASMNGYSASAVNRMPGTTIAGMITFSDSVYWPMTTSAKPGIRRSDPSRNSMYQSGWAPAETMAGSNGP